MSSPKTSSATGDYIKSHKNDYNEIVAMGQEALAYLTQILDKGDKGLKGNIVSLVCTDIVKNLQASGEITPETQLLIDKALESMDKWNQSMGYNLKNSKSATEFTEEEVASARAVVEEYFRAVAAKDDEAVLKTLTLVYNHPNVILYQDEIRTLLSADFNESDPMRKGYIENGRGSVNGTAIENVIVFKVNFSVNIPKGGQSAFSEGNYTNWSMILIREDKNSPWLIDDQGY
jgi:hypothetical protein